MALSLLGGHSLLAVLVSEIAPSGAVDLTSRGSVWMLVEAYVGPARALNQESSQAVYHSQILQTAEPLIGSPRAVVSFCTNVRVKESFGKGGGSASANPHELLRYQSRGLGSPGIQRVNH